MVKLFCCIICGGVVRYQSDDGEFFCVKHWYERDGNVKKMDKSIKEMIEEGKIMGLIDLSRQNEIVERCLSKVEGPIEKDLCWMYLNKIYRESFIEGYLAGEREDTKQLNHQVETLYKVIENKESELIEKKTAPEKNIEKIYKETIDIHNRCMIMQSDLKDITEAIKKWK